ncbi:MAG: response regulator [Bacteroidota bacterium]
MLKKENKGLKILLIEDNPGDQILINEYLEEEFPKLNLDIAANFKEAKNYLNVEPSPYKIILMDLSLPDIDSDSLLKEIIKISPITPIIILTGQDNIHTAIQALTLGCTDYLLKDDINSIRLRKSIIYAFERKHIDKQLESSVNRYQQLFQLNPQPLWVISSHTGEFLEVNNAALNKYGYEKEELLNMHIHDIDPEFNKEEIKEYISENEILINQNLHEHTLKNGQKIHVKLYGNFIDNQGVEAILLMAIDISETESYIKEIELQNKQLQEIAWEQSHLVRAPLTRMMGIINRLEEKYAIHLNEMDGECSFLLKNLMSSAHEMDDVIRSIVKKSNTKNK